MAKIRHVGLLVSVLDNQEGLCANFVDHTNCLGGPHISKVHLVSLLPWTPLLMYKICALGQNVALSINGVPFICWYACDRSKLWVMIMTRALINNKGFPCGGGGLPIWEKIPYNPVLVFWEHTNSELSCDISLRHKTRTFQRTERCNLDNWICHPSCQNHDKERQSKRAIVQN